MPSHEPCVQRADRRGESGAALLVAMLLLMAMALIGFASLNTVMREREVTGYSGQGQLALYGADAALADSLDMMRKQVTGVAVGAGDCLTPDVPSATLANGVTYGPDSTAPCAELDSSIETGQPIYLYTVWNVRTQGVAPTGAASRVQATVERCHAFNN